MSVDSRPSNPRMIGGSNGVTLWSETAVATIIGWVTSNHIVRPARKALPMAVPPITASITLFAVVPLMIAGLRRQITGAIQASENRFGERSAILGEWRRRALGNYRKRRRRSVWPFASESDLSHKVPDNP